MIGILSDAHGNGAAFDRAVEVLTQEGARSFVFLGDAVGYIPGRSVVASILSLGSRIACVRGNHEEMLLSRISDPARAEVYQHSRTAALLEPADVDILREWPDRRRLDCPAGRVLFIHGSPQDPLHGYVYPDTDLTAFDVPEDVVFMGHTHRPFVRPCGNTLFVNVGSCGLPRDDRTLGSAVLFDEQHGDVRVVRFDIQQQNRSVIAAVEGLHPSVRDALVPGIHMSAKGLA